MGRYYSNAKEIVENTTKLSIFKLKEFGLLCGCVATTLTWKSNLSEHKNSIGLLIFMLKAARPQKYAHLRITENTGKIMHTHKDIRDLPPDQQRKRMDEYLKNYNRLMGNNVDGLGNNQQPPAEPVV